MEELGTVDAVVVGAGVLGLAAARALAGRGLDTLLLERAQRIGSGISARSSEVIHAGLYYPSASAKARLCVRGKALLYDYCRSHGVAHRACGKLVVASDPAQLAALQLLAEQGAANGVADLQWLGAAQAQALEPQLRCQAALYSPSTGIIDSAGLMLALRGDFEAAGGQLALNSEVTALRRAAAGLWQLEVQTASGPFRLSTPRVLNAAGLWAAELAQRTQDLAPAHRPALRFCKGSYFSLAGRAPFRHLVYPLPQAGGLGVHLTLDLAGQARFGPDVEWLAAGLSPQALDYRVEPQRAAAMVAAVRRYWPGLPDGALQPAYSGVRPKLGGPDKAAADFRIEGPADHGLPGLVQLLGLESPGLSSCLAVAETVSALLR